MMKKKKSFMRFTFNLFWITLILFFVLFACSGPLSEHETPADVIKQYGEFRDVESDSVSLRTVSNEQGRVTFVIVLGKERYVTLDIFDKNGTYRKTLLNGGWGPGEFGIIWKSESNDIIKAGEYSYELEADHEVLIKGSFSYNNTGISEYNVNSEKIFTVVEVMPEFSGGINALMKYLSDNIKYPEEAKKEGIQGRVFVNFVVEKSGKVNNVNVIRGIGGGCDEEAIRVISSMPDWKPGLENGKAVRVDYNIPIKFALD